MPIDSFKWLPRSIAGYYRSIQIEEPGEIPWTPLSKPLERCRFALVTTAGLYIKDQQPVFDLDRERREPLWGDPSYRVLPSDLRQGQAGVAHLHINAEDIEADVNVALPVHRFRELEDAGEVGALAPHHYSFMGYQQDTRAWTEQYAPEIAQRMLAEEVDAAFITPV